MNNKINKTRLKNFFVYDLLKTVIITVLVGVLLFWGFNLVKVEPSNGQRFVALVANDIYLGDECDVLLKSTCENGASNYGFSYDILNAQYSVVSDSNPRSDLISKRDIYDDDIFITTKTLAEIYLYSGAISFDQYLQLAKEYLSKFQNESGEIVEEKIITNFNKTRAKDNRFKSKSDKEKGIKYEIKRINGLKKNVEILEKVFKNNKQIFSADFLDADYDEGRNEYGYAIEISKLVGKEEKNIKNAFMTKKVIEGQAEPIYTADGIYLMIGRNNDTDGDLFFEPMAYILNLFNTYTNFIEEI